MLHDFDAATNQSNSTFLYLFDFLFSEAAADLRTMIIYGPWIHTTTEGIMY